LAFFIKGNESMQNRIFVVDHSLTPLTPCNARRARELVSSGKARVYRLYPTVVALNSSINFGTNAPITGKQNQYFFDFDAVVPAKATAEIVLKIDPGSKETGLAITLNNMVVWAAVLAHRTTISGLLESRASCRRGRRNRKTRYRKPRFLNRKRARVDGWLPPSLMSRVDNIVNWTAKLLKYCPLTKIEIETVRFDMQKMENPEIEGVEYQQGALAGYELKEYLLQKFGHQCVYCDAKNVPLEVEHIIPRAKGGTNRASNLAIACVKCNQKKGTQSLEEFVKDKDKLSKIKRQLKAPLKDAAAVNATRKEIYRQLGEKFGLPLSVWSGGRTKKNRFALKLPKEHWIDAACVGESGEKVKVNPDQKIFKIKAIGRGTRKIIRTNKSGTPRLKKDGTRQADCVISQVHGFKSKDFVSLNFKGQYRKGIISGVRKAGNFTIDITKGIRGRKANSFSHKICKIIHRKDGYSYS